MYKSKVYDKTVPELKDELLNVETQLDSYYQTLYKMRGPDGLQRPPGISNIEDMISKLTFRQREINDDLKYLAVPGVEQPKPGSGAIVSEVLTPQKIMPKPSGASSASPSPRKVKRYIVRVSQAWRDAQTRAGRNPDQVIKEQVPPGANYTVQGI